MAHRTLLGAPPEPWELFREQKKYQQETKNHWNPGRGCLVPTVLGMKARQRPRGSWGPCYPPHIAHCCPSHTVSVNCLFHTAASWHSLSPCVLAQGLWQSPSSSSESPMVFPHLCGAGGPCPRCFSTLQQPQGFWWGVGVMCRLFTDIALSASAG